MLKSFHTQKFGDTVFLSLLRAKHTVSSSLRPPVIFKSPCLVDLSYLWKVWLWLFFVGLSGFPFFIVLSIPLSCFIRVDDRGKRMLKLNHPTCLVIVGWSRGPDLLLIRLGAVLWHAAFCSLCAWVNEIQPLYKRGPKAHIYFSCTSVSLVLGISEPKVVDFPLKIYSLI